MKIGGHLLLMLALMMASCSKSPSSPSGDPDLDAVCEITSKIMQTPKSELTVDVPVASLKPPLDDLDIVEIVLQLEDRYKISISDADLMTAAGGEKSNLQAKLTLQALAKLVKQARKPK